MWYTVSFIAGALIGVIAMALFAASTMDTMEWRNRRLAEEIDHRDRELNRYQDLLNPMYLNQTEMDSLSDSVEIAG